MIHFLLLIFLYLIQKLINLYISSKLINQMSNVLNYRYVQKSFDPIKFCIITSKKLFQFIMK